MSKIGVVQNGLKRKTNGTAKRKSNPLGLARVKGFAKKNGLKLVPKGTGIKTAINPKRRKGRKRRNGLATKSFSLTRRNGLLGNTKSDAKNVGALLGGMLGGKAVSRVVQSFATPYLSQVGLGNYAEIVCDGVIALVVAPYVASKVGGASAAQFARLGGLANVAVDAIEIIAPNTLSMFGSNALVQSGNRVGLSPAAVSAIVNSTSAPVAEKAKVAGAMAALESGVPIDSYGGNVVPMMPLYS